MAAIDDAVSELKKLTSLTSISITVQKAMLSAALGGTSVATPTVAGVAPTLPVLIGTHATGPTGPHPLPPGYTATTAPAGAIPASGVPPPHPHPPKAPPLPWHKRVVSAFMGGMSRGRKFGLGKAVGSRVKAGAAGVGVARAAAAGASGVGAGAAVGAFGAIVATGGVIAGVVLGVIAATRALSKFTDSALNSQRHLAEVSGSMAAVMAERDMLSMVRDMKLGEATAGTAKDLVEAEDRRKKATLPMEEFITNFGNKILTGLNDLASTLLEPLGDLVAGLNDILGWSKKIEPLGLAGEMKDLRDRSGEIDRMGKDMMEAARAAAGKRGVAAPAGAAPPGGIPGMPRMAPPL